MLLISPSADINSSTINSGLSKYQGELFIILGDRDPVINMKTAQNLADQAKKAKKKQIIQIADCDHQFPEEKNAKIFLSKVLNS